MVSCHPTRSLSGKGTGTLLQAVLLFFIFTFCAKAQTLRPTHWSEQYIRYLQAHGELWELSPFLRPYDITEVQMHLGEGSAHHQFLRAALSRWQLQPGEASIAIISENRLTNGDPTASFRTSVLTGGLTKKDPPWLYHGRHRLELAYRLRPWLQIFNSMAVDNRLDENPRYIGIHQGGFAGLTERAGIRLQYDGFSAVIGREYLQIGPGLDAALLVSGWGRPMDQIAFSYQYRWLRYDFITAELDFTSYAQEGAPAQQNRFFSLHHLQLRFSPKLYLGIGEAVLYSGSSLQLNYLNPFLAYYGEVTNGPASGNILGSIHVAAMPVRTLTLYADLLIDDIQLENSVPGDREPAEYGVMAGALWADPLNLKGGALASEYTRITNRTYNGEGGPWERWLHRGEPIAHFLGNDFDRWVTTITWWPSPLWRTVWMMDLRRRGEGRIEKEFDRPWLEIPPEQEYHEPFPTGVVEKSGRYSIELSYQPRIAVLACARIGYCDITNLNHQRGARRGQWQGILGLEFDLIHKIGMD